ncbi:DNA polymerase III delta subunit [Nocardia puris]|uniref:DNA-directed DNA polymerase n=1 Tax=Nocardia puris TaxID=208602 RepID=A0A366DEA5_9NOCA|nr:DNA polymerase III delta subunit [Nocardia puris]
MGTPPPLRWRVEDGVREGVSVGDRRIGRVSGRPAAVHLVLGEEELLMERAIAGITAAVRADAPDPDAVPVDRMRAGDASSAELAELLSPSLFAEDRVIILESAAEAGKEAVSVITQAAADPPDGVVLVVLHSGGGRAKALAPALQKAGAQVHECAKLTKASERVEFVRGEFRTAGVRVPADVVQVVLESVGSDLRELAAACSQLIADTGGKIDVAAVRQYYSGRAEVSGFDVAELAVGGDRPGAMEALRWALDTGVPHVLLADALADSVHTIARVGSAGRGDPFKLAQQLGMPPWKVKKAQAQARGWTGVTIGSAMQVVATLNADVKGGAADSGYALEHALMRILDLHGAG